MVVRTFELIDRAAINVRRNQLGYLILEAVKLIGKGNEHSDEQSTSCIVDPVVRNIWMRCKPK